MQTSTDVTFRKLCYLLHRSFVEARKLAQLQQEQQLFDLADTFELFPGFLPDWNEEHGGVVRAALQTYQNKYNGRTFDYLAVLDMPENEFMEVLSTW